ARLASPLSSAARGPPLRPRFSSQTAAFWPDRHFPYMRERMRGAALRNDDRRIKDARRGRPAMRRPSILDVLRAVKEVGSTHPEVRGWWYAPGRRMRLQGAFPGSESADGLE